MATKLLENSSFALTRTNPKLTTNVKLVVSSEDGLFLESFDANDELSKARYKAFKVSEKNTYDFDLSKFYSKGKTPSDITFSTLRISSDISVQDSYGKQFEFQYNYGAAPINSKTYNEEFGILAPIWLEDTIPNYFVVFRVDGPVNVNNVNADDENFNAALASDPELFVENILKKSTIIKTFDLTENSVAGKYIRNYRGSERFPRVPLIFSTGREQSSKWNGIDIKSGGFSSKDEFAYDRIFATDSTIIEDDNYITQGFERNNIAIANIMNMQFLFDDSSADDFSVNRYFGLYVNQVEEGTFQISGKRYFNDSAEEQYPRPDSEMWIEKNTTAGKIVTNENGVKLYAEDSSIKVNYVTGDIDSDLVPDIFPRDFLPTTEDVSSLVSIFYVQDKENNFYNLKTGGNWTDKEQLRLSNKEVDLSKFTGSIEPLLSTTGRFCEVERGRASSFLEITDEIPHGDRYVAGLVSKQTYEFNTDSIIPGDIFTISDGTNSINVNAVNSDPNDLFDDIKSEWDNSGFPNFEKFHVSATNNKLVVVERDLSGLDVDFTVSVTGSSTFTVNKVVSASLQNITITADLSVVINPGESDGRFFNPTGTTEEIAKAMASAFNSLDNRIFDATAIGSTVALVSKIGGSRFNQLVVGRSLFLSGPHVNIVSNSPGFTHPEFEVKYFEGGSEGCDNRVTVDINLLNTFRVPNRYLKTISKNPSDPSLKPIQQVSYYIDEPIINKKGEITGYKDFDKYCVVLLKDGEEIYSDVYKKIYLYELYDIRFGRFSIFPIKDMDFDFYSEEYGDEKELNIESSYYSTFGDISSEFTHENIEDFYENKEFATLEGVLQVEDPDNEISSAKIETEYDRLFENYLKEITTPSRIVPTVNKWVYRNGKNVRETDYRLSSSEAFGTNNFSPSSDDFDREVNSFTHEWYYLQKLPPYFGEFDVKELNNVFSYFPENIDVTSTGLLDINFDYFTDYFTVDMLKYPIISTTGNIIESEQNVAVDKQVRYSIFEGGNSTNFSTAFHRGVKVIVKERVENNIELDFNLQNIKLKQSNKYNNYKFSCVLIPHSGEYGGVTRKRIEIEFIENEQHQCITLLIYANIQDVLTEVKKDVTGVIVTDQAGFIDRTILYALNSRYVSLEQSDLNTDGTMSYADVELSGAIDLTPTNGTNFGTGDVFGIPDINGDLNRFLEEIKVNEDGSYNRIVATSGPITRDFRVLNVLSDNQLLGEDFQSPAQPIGISLSQIQNGTYIYEDGGYTYWESRLNRLSFANIASLINKGSSEVNYTTIASDGTIKRNAFIIELQTAKQVVRPNYLKPIIDVNKPVNFNLTEVIGYELDYQKRARIQPIYRHSGFYQPKFNDIIKFEDPYVIEEYSNSLERDSQIKNLLKDVNTQLKLGDNFSIIKNLFYHKVNDVNSKGVLELSAEDAFKPLYPLIGEYAIDKRDFYLWLSNWDPAYFKKNITKNITEDKIGTRSIIDNKSFFSSKIMKISENVQVDTFNALQEFTEDTLTITGEKILQDSVNFELAFLETERSFILDIYLEKRLIEYIANLGVRDFFLQYIKPEFGFGLETSLEDDITFYIKQNILPRYTIGNIDLYVRKSRDESFNDTFPIVNSSLTDNEKLSIDMIKEKDFNVTRLSSRSNFNTKLIYNKTKGYKYTIAPSFKIIKK